MTYGPLFTLYMFVVNYQMDLSKRDQQGNYFTYGGNQVLYKAYVMKSCPPSCFDLSMFIDDSIRHLFTHSVVRRRRQLRSYRYCDFRGHGSIALKYFQFLFF